MTIGFSHANVVCVASDKDQNGLQSPSAFINAAPGTGTSDAIPNITNTPKSPSKLNKTCSNDKSNVVVVNPKRIHFKRRRTLIDNRFQTTIQYKIINNVT